MGAVTNLTHPDHAQALGKILRTKAQIGAALDRTHSVLYLGASTGETFAVRLDNAPALRAVESQLFFSERKIWSDRGSNVALAMARALDKPVAEFDFVRCLRAFRAVLEPGTEKTRQARPRGLGATAVSTAQEVERFQATYPVELRRLALRSVKAEALWRPQMLRGWRLDMKMLKAETLAAWGSKRDLAIENGIDLTEDSAEVLAWVARRGIAITDPETKLPSLSRDHFDAATMPDSALPAWKIFRTARSLKSVLAKLAECTYGEISDRLFSEVVLHHTVTGRSAVMARDIGRTRRAGAGLHNISAKLRPLLVADPGHVLVSLDIDRCEIALSAAMSGDEDLAAALAAGDPYIELAVRLDGEGSRNDTARRVALKKAMIASLYGQGIASLASDLGIDQAPAEALRDSLRVNWPRVFEWIGENTAAAKRGEEAFTIDGRPLMRLDRADAYKSTNHRVQGSGASLLTDATIRVAERLGDALWLSVHDEIVVQVLPENAAAAVTALEECVRWEINDVVISGKAAVLGESWGKA